MVGFDGSPAAERALDRAAAHAGTDGRVLIVTASVSLPQAGVVDEPILDSPSPGQRDAVFESAPATLRSRGVEPELVAADAAPVQALVEAARERDADLIVVGSAGWGYVTRAIVGSTAENVVRQAPCDVLVVR